MATALISWLMVASAVFVAIPTVVLCIELAAALVRRADPSPASVTYPPVAVLVPAHNESGRLIPTLTDIKAQLRPGDRLLVVADNCTDDTAAVAGLEGAEVIARDDLNHIGKGYALDFGLRYLEQEPRDVVVMFDADCRIAFGSIARLAHAGATLGRPAQALYLMSPSAGSGIGGLIAAFAWRIKNWVRPLGLAALGLPCQLVGTGMAFPYLLIRDVTLATPSIVEDINLGLELAAAGRPAVFCASALVTSDFAASEAGYASQRRRWEHGHITTIIKRVPSLLIKATTSGNIGLLALTLDIAVPPLSLMTMLLGGVLLATALSALLGFGSLGLIISAVSFAAFVGSLVLAWAKFGRDALPATAVLSVPFYVFSKLGLYGQLLQGKSTTRWVRTDRGND
jgi:cellulose synthase/poly-beta-1,6-N-acetylglucosamine synthase-like glycosyltransferase